MTDIDRVAAVLRRLGEGPPDETVSIGEAIDRLGARAHLLVLVLLAAPNLTPGPSLPGFSTALGLPAMFVAGQLALGRRQLWLPRRLRAAGVARRRLGPVLRRAVPVLERIERVMRPRWRALAGPAAERATAFACVLLAALLSLPIPVYAMLPALAILVVALGGLQDDGVAVAIGLAIGLASIAVLAGLVWAFVAVVE